MQKTVLLRVLCCSGYAPLCEWSIFDEHHGISVGLYVCLSLHLSVCQHVSGIANPNFTKFSVHIASGRGSVLLWRRCDKICTSGFADDVVFSNNGSSLWRSNVISAFSLQSCAMGSTPAVWHWLCPQPSCIKRRTAPRLDKPSCKRCYCWDRVCDASLPCFFPIRFNKK